MARFFKRSSPPPEDRPADATASGWAPQPAGPQPDPDRIGISGSVPFVRLPKPGTLFAERAKRLRALGADHPMAGYLAFLATIADAQAGVAAERMADPPEPSPAEAVDAALRAENGMPPLSRTAITEDPAVLRDLEALLSRLDLSAAPDAARAAHDALLRASPEDRLDLATQVFEGAYPVAQMAECLFVAAALQVSLAVRASRLDEKTLKPVADGVCPSCGGAPTASLIVSWTPADKARYLSCSLCATLWNHVRIRCTACGSGEGISYYGIDEISKDVQVETCTTCHSYLKHLHQHRDPALDPIADDIASYGVDLKIVEEGFRKAGLNPMLIN